jgi:hypothetical protein
LARDKLEAVSVRFDGGRVYITLNDGRDIGLPLDYPDLRWLREATPQQRAHWTIEPGGYAVYWPELDDGIEVEHLLRPIPHQ